MRDDLYTKNKYFEYLRRELNVDNSFKYSNKFINLPYMGTKELNIINNAVSKKKGNCVYFSSGTTGKPKAVYYTQDDMFFSKKYISWMCGVEGLPKGSTVIVLMDQSFWGIGYFTCLGHMAYGNKVIPVDTDLPNQNIREIIQTLKPSVISSIPSILIDKSRDLNDLCFDFIETTGELLSIEHRNYIEEQYKGVIFDAYGLTESVVGVECKMHQGYHFKEGKVYLEIVNTQGELIQDGEFGEIILTIIDNKSRPLIRYQTGDRGKITHNRCSCGVKYPRVYIDGRLKKVYSLYEGYKLEHEEIRKLIYQVYGTDKDFDVKLIIQDGQYIFTIVIKDGNKDKNNGALSKLKKLNFEIMHMVRNNKIDISIV